MADQSEEGLLSPFLRRQRFKAVKPFLKGRILDVGCGSGALAGLIDPASYIGVEVDDISLSIAKDQFPDHYFTNMLPPVAEKFDTVASLAVIEHVQDPGGFLKILAQYLNNYKNGALVITTPHPSMDFIHGVGAMVGLFSKHANQEHIDLLDRRKLIVAGKCAGLAMVKYKRFLFGGNQLAVFARDQ